MKITDDNLCNICSNSPEQLMHLFLHCPEISQLWLNLQILIKNKTHHQIVFTPQMIILGYQIKNNIHIPINTIILATKSYIFWCSRKKKKPNIFELQKRIKHTYMTELTISQLNFKHENFLRIWHQISPIFENI